MKISHLEPLYQLQTLLWSFENDDYATCLPVLNGSSVGQHTRHILEFYECLYAGFTSGVVNYEARQRQSRIKLDIDFTLDFTANLIKKYSDINDNQKLYLEVENEHLETSLKRELHYLAEHTIHHLAIIRIGLQECLPTIAFEENLGIAPSTLKYRETVSAC